jgi:autotransporter passenger strand-loop-strand repeat protein
VQVIQADGTTVSTNVLGGGAEFTKAAGIAVGTTINSGGVEYVDNFGIAISATIDSAQGKWRSKVWRSATW